MATAPQCETDLEMLERINLHKRRRGTNWETVEEPIFIADIIKNQACSERPILVDCLTIWLSNLMFAECDVKEEFLKLTNVLDQSEGAVIFVSNEVGLGTVPLNKVARDFRDYAGSLNQLMAKKCERVIMVVAGITTILKDE